MSSRDLESLAVALYGACWDQYDSRRLPFADPRTGELHCRDIEGAWSWLHEEQRKMVRDQARRAEQWFRERGMLR
jgi:hypothetical protein